MSKILKFLKECGVFYVLTVNADFPAGRPFGAIMEYEDNLYISTTDIKDVYKQLKEHSKMQIIALKAGTREWVRISGIAEECVDLSLKQKMLEECPILTKHFSSADAPHFSVFQVKVVDKNLYE
jgi:uncharacterized pyridoxamine 5'-phosphate oxidase family protein